ncbi:MAG: type II secretion system F family protein, partial [Nitrospira sp.]|nr:type II secretion system F family protein [Nitrospira sp.]
MNKFTYEAIDEKGLKVKGILEADSVSMAENMLVSKGYIPSRVLAEKSVRGSAGLSGISGWGGHVRTSDLILFTKQFRSMLRAGIPMLRLLEVLEAQTESRTLKNVIASMEQDIKQGASIADSMGKHPKVFSPLYRSMVGAGEVSGTMPEVLSRLIYIIEHEAKIKSDIKSALQYPVVVLITLVIAFFILLTFVIPKFARIFVSAGLALPLPTRIAILLYQILISYWYVLIAGFISLILGLRYYFNTEQGRYVRDSLILRIPLIGNIFVKASMSRFASIFSILQASGIPVISTLAILTGTIGNAAISRAFENVGERLREGEGIAGPLRSARYFTPMVIDMIAVGEESGNLDEMLREITAHYDDEVEYAVKGLSGAIGPVLMVGLAVVVGF